MRQMREMQMQENRARVQQQQSDPALAGVGEKPWEGATVEIA